jgi:outer membrane immunogenic protein
MMYNKKIAIALAVLSLAAPLGAAHAQSLNDNSWTGFYAGVNAGGLFSSTSASITENNTGGGLSGTGGGFVGGVQGGYNYMFGPVVLGGEIDFQGSTLTSGLTGGVGGSNITATQAMPWFSTIRARVGYPVGKIMPYVTGGAVWGEQTLSGYDSAASGSFSASNNFWTYTFGGGVEGKLDNHWSAKLEYLWLGTPSNTLSTPATTSVSERSIGNVIRVGLNYRFD